MKFISWNVNGLRACVGKDFESQFKALDADFFCLQETKMQEGQLDLKFEGYESYWNYAEKKGYSGTAIYTRHQPLSVSYGMGVEEHDHEGRVITLEYDNFYLVTCYTPNSQTELKRLDYRMTWEGLGCQEACGGLRRPERGTSGDRYQESEDQPSQCRFYRRGAREDDRASERRLYRYLPLSASRRGYLFVVVIPIQGTREECRLAYRLLPGIRPLERTDYRSQDSYRHHGQRPLPGRG